MFDESIDHLHAVQQRNAFAWNARVLPAAHPASTASGPVVAVLMHATDVATAESAVNALGLNLRCFAPGDLGLDAMLALNPPLVLTEIANAGFTGFDLIKSLRARGYRGRIFALIGKDDLLTSVIGLEMGADLILEQPLNSRLLQTYLKKALSTGPAHDGALSSGAMRFGEMVIDMDQRCVRYRDHELHLSEVEFDLLSLLCSRPGQVWSRAEISASVGRGFNLESRGTDSRICRLRKRLAQHGIDAIRSIRGRGYLFSGPGIARAARESR